jgi:hypothetical protein
MRCSNKRPKTSHRNNRKKKNTGAVLFVWGFSARQASVRVDWQRGVIWPQLESNSNLLELGMRLFHVLKPKRNKVSKYCVGLESPEAEGMLGLPEKGPDSFPYSLLPLPATCTVPTCPGCFVPFPVSVQFGLEPLVHTLFVFPSLNVPVCPLRSTSISISQTIMQFLEFPELRLSKK